MTWLDVLLLALLAGSLYSGYRRGAVLQVIGIAGLIVGVVAGVAAAPRVAQLAGSPATAVALVLGTVLVAGAIGNMLGWAAGSRLRRRTHDGRVAAGRRRGRLGDLGGRPAARDLVPGAQPRRGTVPRRLEGPPGLRDRATGSTRPCRHRRRSSGEASHLLALLGFPDVFIGLPQEPSAPVEPPDGAQAKAATRAATALDGRGARHRVQPGLREPGQRLRRRRRPRHHERARGGRHRASNGCSTPACAPRRRWSRSTPTSTWPCCAPAGSSCAPLPILRRGSRPGRCGRRARLSGRWVARRRGGGGARGHRARRTQHLRRGSGASACLRGAGHDPPRQQRRSVRARERAGGRTRLRELGRRRRRGLRDRVERIPADAAELRRPSPRRSAQAPAPAEPPQDRSSSNPFARTASGSTSQSSPGSGIRCVIEREREQRRSRPRHAHGDAGGAHRLGDDPDLGHEVEPSLLVQPIVQGDGEQRGVAGEGLHGEGSVGHVEHGVGARHDRRQRRSRLTGRQSQASAARAPRAARRGADRAGAPWRRPSRS